MSALPPKGEMRAFGEYSQAGGAIATRLVQYLVRSLAVDAADRFDQFNQIDQARHAAGVCQYRANRDYQARCRFIKSRFTAPSIVRAQHLDDSLIEICQRIGAYSGLSQFRSYMEHSPPLIVRAISCPSRRDAASASLSWF